MENTEYKTFNVTQNDFDIDEQCCLCGKDVKHKEVELRVHTYGGGEIIHPKDDGINDDSTYTGTYLIGSSCAKKLPKDYIVTHNNKTGAWTNA